MVLVLRTNLHKSGPETSKYSTIRATRTARRGRRSDNKSATRHLGLHTVGRRATGGEDFRVALRCLLTAGWWNIDMRLVARIVLFTAVLLPAFIRAADTGSMRNVVLVRVPNGGQAVAAKITEDGTLHLLYNSGDIPYYAKSSDGGGTFSSPIAVVDKASRKPGLDFSGMSMAAGKGDTVYVAMITNNWKTKLPDVPDGFIYSTLAPGAKAFTPVRSLNRLPSEGFSLAADGNGDVAAS